MAKSYFYVPGVEPAPQVGREHGADAGPQRAAPIELAEQAGMPPARCTSSMWYFWLFGATLDRQGTRRETAESGPGEQRVELRVAREELGGVRLELDVLGGLDRVGERGLLARSRPSRLTVSRMRPTSPAVVTVLARSMPRSLSGA